MKNKQARVIWIIGVAIMLFAAFVVYNGILFGERNTGIAVILFIIGLSLVVKGTPLWAKKKKGENEKTR